ncbi:MAG: hypothetical protein RBS80_31860, partial [Thermoguttaceae bacterium]|nr:hypothetical protein [Thermoguttaceae bacterium]
TGFANAKWTRWNPSLELVDVMAADFTGDGKADIAGRVATSGDWWVAESTGNGFTNAKWTRWNPTLAWGRVLVGNFAPAHDDEVSDPSVGFTLVSWWEDIGDEAWSDGVNELDQAGFPSVQFVTFRFVDENTGTILPLPHEKIPSIEGIEVGIARAKELGKSITWSTFVELPDFSWRGYLTFDEPSADEFFQGYTEYVVDVAMRAELLGVDRVVVGSELDGIAGDPAHLHRWDGFLNAVDSVFSGDLGYAANWDRYNDPNIAAAIWNHDAIDFMGVDAYPPVALTEEANPIQAFPDETFIALMQGRWSTFLDEVSSFAAQQKGGRGMPVVLTEVGFSPNNLTTTAPWDGNVTEVPDPYERVNAYEALLRATEGRGDQIREVLVWHWDMPGTTGSPYLHNANEPAGAFLASFVSQSNVSQVTQAFSSGGRLGELPARPGTDTVHRSDLLIAVMHESGHVPGHDHAESGPMEPALAPGLRWLSDLDAISPLADEPALLADGALEPARLDAYFATLG